MFCVSGQLYQVPFKTRFMSLKILTKALTALSKRKRFNRFILYMTYIKLVTKQHWWLSHAFRLFVMLCGFLLRFCPDFKFFDYLFSQFQCRKIPVAPSDGVNISELIRYSRNNRFINGVVEIIPSLMLRTQSIVGWPIWIIHFIDDICYVFYVVFCNLLFVCLSFCFSYGIVDLWVGMLFLYLSSLF